jgi:hypothetical protein
LLLLLLRLQHHLCARRLRGCRGWRSALSAHVTPAATADARRSCRWPLQVMPDAAHATAAATLQA